MNLQKIESEALHLPKGERASLIQSLVLSFDMPTAQELREDWLVEAQGRAKELDDRLATPIPGDEVLRRARALIK
jgi:hypothetical protein